MSGRPFNYYAKLEHLAESQAYYQTIIDVIADIQLGLSESAACKKHKVSVSDFRYNTIYRKRRTLNDDTNVIYKPPSWRIWEKVTGIKITSRNFVQLPVDIEDTMIQMLKILTPRQQEAIQHVYFEELTCSDAAKLMGITHNRPQQLIDAALHTFRQPSNRFRITYGDAFISNLHNKQQEYSEALIDKQLADEQAANLHLVNLNNPRVAMPIDVLDLSIRTYNALKRSKVSTIRDAIMLIRNNKIQKLRGIGSKGADEVTTTIQQYLQYGNAER